MKPFLGIDITEDKHNTRKEGSELLAAQPSEFMSEELDRSIEAAAGVENRSKLPLPLRIAEYICGTVAAFLIFSVIGAMSRADIGVAQAYANAPALFWICGICLVIWAPLYLAAKSRKKSVADSGEGAYAAAKLESISSSVLAELGVPSSATTVDILEVEYKLKNGEPKIRQGALDAGKYDNNEYHLYTDGDKLCIADVFGRYDFPLDSLRRIRTVKKSVGIKTWNKYESPTAAEYKQYKITSDKYNNLYIKAYHILELDYAGETWGIYFPNYDLPAFESATGLRAEAK